MVKIGSPWRDDFEDLANQLWIPERFQVEVTLHDVPAVVEITVTIEDGSPVCDELRFKRAKDGPTITSAVLQDFPLHKVVHLLAFNAAQVDHQSPSWVTSPESIRMSTDALPDQEQRKALQELAPRRRRITDAFLREVADVYRGSLEGGAPTQSVAHHFSVAHSSAARYVNQARERGLLGRTTSGRAGESPSSVASTKSTKGQR